VESGTGFAAKSFGDVDGSKLLREDFVDERLFTAEARQQREVDIHRFPGFSPSQHASPPIKQNRQPADSQNVCRPAAA
jgi:hypothetical protein